MKASIRMDEINQNYCNVILEDGTKYTSKYGNTLFEYKEANEIKNLLAKESLIEAVQNTRDFEQYL